MLHENEGEAMTATMICICGPWRRNMMASSIRAIKPGPRVAQIRWLQTLLVVLLAGQVSCDYTFPSRLAAVTPSATTAQPLFYYSLDVTVDVKGRKKDESEIKDWLIQVFTDYLDSCASSGPTETTTSPPAAATDPSAETPAPPKNNTTPSLPFTSKVTRTLPDAAGRNLQPAESIKARAARQASASLTQTSTSSKSASTFKAIEMSCVVKTSIRSTTCFMIMQLRQRVDACCVLRILCTASKASKELQVVGTKVDRQSGMASGCTGKPPEESSCVYKGPTSPSCEESGPGYVAENVCGPAIDIGEKNCSCSAYCSRTDAYYTLQVLVHDPALQFSEMFSMITGVSTAPVCTSSIEFLCTPPIIASQYKGANMTCEGTVTNLESCKVILAFAREVPICNISAAMINIVQADRRISYSGQVTEVAICGNGSNNPLTTQALWESSEPRPATVCSETEKPPVYPCEKGKNVVVELKKQCIVVPITTARPNVTTMKPNATASPVNTTTSPVNTTSVAVNATLNTTATPTNVSVTANTTLNATATPTNMSVTANTTLNTTATPTNMSVTANTTLNTTATTGNLTTESNLSAEAMANALLAMTRDVSKLNASQVAWLVSQLEKLLSGPNVSLTLGNISVHIVSNLLGASPEVLAPSATRIIGVVDTVGLKLVLKDKAETLTFPFLALSVKPADGSNFKETFFSITDPNNIQVRADPRLTRSVRADASIPQGSIILPPSLTQSLKPEQQQQVSRVQFSFYQKSTVFQDKSLGQRILNSGILAASVSNLSISGLKDNVTIQLRNTKTTPNSSVPVCVFWDFTFNEGSGGWNSEGCSLQNSTDSVTVCGCNHLTSFAILLDLARQPIASQVHNTILTFITYIGCGISAIFLSITLLTYLAFGKLRKDIPSKILIQLCLALLLLNLVFLVDAWLALYPDAIGLCISTAWFLHYFLLVSFTWMGLEAVHMYLALVKVFNSHISHYMLRFSAAGWGIPMLVVIIVIAIDKDNYGLVSYGKFADGTSDDFCWLKNDIAFYVAVVAYFCVIFLFNIVMFVVVLVQLCRIKRQNPHNVQHRTTLQDVRSVMGITILLGLTWGFAFFAWGPVNLAFMYLFAIFNSLQGFLIFVFHCAVKENVRRQWRTYLCCGRMRLAENSEWSRTATQKNVKSSLNTPHHSRSSQSNNSSSSFFLGSEISEPVNGVGSPFEDRIMTADEDPSMDVVLNEINSQYRNQQDS